MAADLERALALEAARAGQATGEVTSVLRTLPGVKILNSDDPEQSCGIGLISVDNFEASKLVGYLWNKYRVWTTSFNSPGEYQGLRITPNVYTTLEEIDAFTEAMRDVIKRGSIPA